MRGDAVLRTLSICAALASSLMIPGLARAETLVLVAPDPALTAAVRVALEPWGTEVRVAAAVDGRGAARGARVAEETGAAAVSWIEGGELWIYEARTGAAIARPVTPPPYDAASATAVALSLKTWLRRTALDPEVAPPPPRDEPAEAPAPAAPPETSLLVGARIGPRFAATSPDLAELRAGITGAVFFLGGHLGVGLELSSGFGVGVDAPAARGRWTETGLALTLEGRATPERWLDLGLRVGVSAGLGWLGVTLAPSSRSSSRSVEVGRFLPAALAEVSLGIWPTERVRLGVALGVDAFLLRQRYRVRGEPLLDVSPAAPRVALVVEFVL